MLPSLSVSASTIAEASMGFLTWVADFVTYTTIGNAAIVVLHFLFLGQLTLDNGKMVHWIPPVGFLIPFLQAVFVP